MPPSTAKAAAAATPTLSASQLQKSVLAPDGSLLSILRDVSLQIHASESVAIIGSSGSGKTTLLCLLAGLDNPDEGEIWLMQQPLHQMSQEERAAARSGRVGFVFQDFQLIPGMTALENVMLPLELVGHKSASEVAMHWLDKMDMANRAGHYPPQLSGGERQRVSLARAFAPSPQLLFADEPTGNLDEKTSQKLAQILLNPPFEQPPAVIIVTHDLSLAETCDRRLLLRDGRLIPA